MIVNFTSFFSGLIIGGGIGFFSRELANATAQVAKPSAKKVIKLSLATLEEGKKSMSKITDSFGDMVAEAQDEMDNDEQASRSKIQKKSRVSKKPRTRAKAS